MLKTTLYIILAYVAGVSLAYEAGVESKYLEGASLSMDGSR